VKEVAGHEYEAQPIPPVVLVGHRRLRISSRVVPIEVIEGRVPVTESVHVDYLFQRLFSLVQMLLKASGRGG
jgi:hypothetical protein